MKQIYTSLDLGSDGIKIIVAEYYKQSVNVLSVADVPSKGIKRGLIVDPDAALSSLNEALKQTEDILGLKVTKVIANVPSYFAEFSLIKGEMNIPTDEEGNQEPVDGAMTVKVLQIAARPHISTSKEMITMQPIDFNVDGKYSQDPKGMIGSKLGVRAILVETPTKNVASVVKLCEMAGLEVEDISISGIGDMYANHYKDMEKEVGIIVNFGAETTTVSLYNKGIIVKNSVIQMGGKSVDNDLAYMYHLTFTEASSMKERFAHACKNNADTGSFYETKNDSGEAIKLNQYEVSEVVQARLEEILGMVRDEMKTMTDHKLDYVILTGGVSNIKDFVTLTGAILGKSAIIENVKIIGIRDNKYSVALGNIMYFISKTELKGEQYSMLSSAEQEELASIKKNLVNASKDTMLGKVFGYFFNE